MKWKGQIDGPLSQYATFDDKHNLLMQKFYSDVPHSKGITGRKHFFDL